MIFQAGSEFLRERNPKEREHRHPYYGRTLLKGWPMAEHADIYIRLSSQIRSNKKLSMLKMRLLQVCIQTCSQSNN